MNEWIDAISMRIAISVGLVVVGGLGFVAVCCGVESGKNETIGTEFWKSAGP